MVAVLLLGACKKGKPLVCVQVDDCCKSLEADAKASKLGRVVGDAVDSSACTGTEGLTKDHCADYARRLKQAFGQAQQDERTGGAPAPKMTPACRDMTPYAE